MDRERFESEMRLAEIKGKIERADYWIGYRRELRRAYHGEKFGTLEEHREYLDAINSFDQAQRETGKEYADALQDWEEKL